MTIGCDLDYETILILACIQRYTLTHANVRTRIRTNFVAKRKVNVLLTDQLVKTLTVTYLK